jgi:DNA-binding MarR family transcriptional regulator
VSRSRQDAIREFGTAIQRYQRSVHDFDQAVAVSMDLGSSDLRCLDALFDGPLPAGEIAQQVGLKPAATTTLIDRLVARGFVRRIASETDRRKVVVEMTEQARQQTWTSYGPLVAEGERMLSRLTSDQLLEFKKLIEAMTQLTDKHRQRVTNDVEE